MFEHEHPLNFIDLWSKQLKHEEDYEEDEEESDDDLIVKQNFQCLCSLCEEEINWFHRYYYTCCQCDNSFHKFCIELPATWEYIFHAHTLYFLQPHWPWWYCKICNGEIKRHHFLYHCSECDFSVHVNCATKVMLKNIIHHPSHIHPLVCITKQILSECDACGEEHKGTFYRCTMCSHSFIHKDCAFLPKKLEIQHTTDNFFSHIHPLTLKYSSPDANQAFKTDSRCRVCDRTFYDQDKLWIYECDKCRYYTHLNCATSRKESFMSILTSPGTGKTMKNYDDAKHPDLVHLPFPDPSYSILKHLFFDEKGSGTLKLSKEVTKTHDISHQHPVVLLEDAPGTCPPSSRIKSISFHDPMKRIELLCDGCLRPITTTPIYVCTNEDEHCNFVLHEWCSRLPTELIHHFDHPRHTLILHSKVPGKFYGVFNCDICSLPCNGFVYCCEECKYYIDVNCAFLPEEITHASHPNHLLSRVYAGPHSNRACKVCLEYARDKQIVFICHICDKVHVHPKCALLVPETTTHKCDKHPMRLSYFPVENHKSDYFCEICEEIFNPAFPFYHCHECMQSIHTGCASSILRYETYASLLFSTGPHEFVNVKFGGTFTNIKMHPHPLSFVQGIADDGQCSSCGRELQYKMIFKCSNCEFAVDYDCKLNKLFRPLLS